MRTIGRCFTKFTWRLFIILFASLSLFAISEGQEVNADQRLTPKEIDQMKQIGASAGTSGVSGIQTRILKGEPTKTWFIYNSTNSSS